jgi:hypothetical protein
MGRRCGGQIFWAVCRARCVPLQVVQNDYIRHLCGARRSVPAQVLCSGSCLPPLARAWLGACGRQWDRMVRAPCGILRSALLSNLALTRSLPPEEHMERGVAACHELAGPRG